MADYDFLKDLLDELESYTISIGETPHDIGDFARWLGQKHHPSQQGQELMLDQKWKERGKGGEPHFIVSNLLTALGRYKMYYVKMALSDSLFETYDEFAYVLSLVFRGPSSHTQLIEKHIQLKPTGTEIIRRLIRKKLIHQQLSEKDKRSKIVMVTEEGRTAFYKALDKISSVTRMVMSPLSEAEKVKLLALLQKLDTPHRALFMNERHLSLQELLQKFGVE